MRKTAQKDSSASGAKKTSDPIEERVVAFAKHLGSMVGTVEAKAEGWLDRKALTTELGRIRDKAAELLDRVNRETSSARTAAKETATSRAQTAAKQTAASPAQTAAKPTPASGTPPTRGPVDAPGKRHRQPLPNERIDRLMGEPTGKQMGQKSRSGRRGGRG